MINFRLARAAEHDLPFIMATERHEGYDAVVGRWDEELAWCRDQGYGRTDPNPAWGQATRT